jgi:hypothetical protein
MRVVKEDKFEDCNVIYIDCCLTMAKRFEKLGEKYIQEGKLELAAKLEAEAVVQLDAWRKARNDIKRAG